MVTPDLARLRVLILAGGASSRFFPLNKVLADPTGRGRTLIQQAFDRVVSVDEEASLVDASRFHVVTGADGREAIRRQLGLSADRVLVEPARRNTWPAILWALAHLRRLDPRSTIAILTADHVIGDEAIFRSTLTEAVRVAQSSPAIVTIGIAPSERAGDWTGFGAIRAADAPASGVGGSASRILEFEEKPTKARAAEMLAEGGWSWNAGMFVFDLETAEAALESFQPEMAARHREVCAALDAGRLDDAARSFEAMPGKIPHPGRPGLEADNSIDYAVMMPLVARPQGELQARVLPGRFPWTDIGSWAAVRRVAPRDANGNVVVGRVELESVRDSVLLAESGWTIEARDLEGAVVVVSRNGSTLVTSVEASPDIKPLVEAITAGGSVVHSLDCLDVDVEGGESPSPLGVFRLRHLVVRRRGKRLCVRPAYLREAGSAADSSPPAELSYRSACHRVLPLGPAVNHYAWGAHVLPDFLGRRVARAELPVAEAWLTSTQEDGQVRFRDPLTARGEATLAELVRRHPEVLGSWSRKLFGDELPVFAKFLSTRFPPRAHMGLKPEVLEGSSAEAVRAKLLEGLREEWKLLRELRDVLAARIDGEESFESFRRAYEFWAVDQAAAGWKAGDRDADFLRALRALAVDDACADLVPRLRENRARIVSLFNEVDLAGERGELLLSSAGMAHSIFGLSHQSHPRDRAGERLRELLVELRERASRGEGEESLLEIAERASGDLRRLRAENPAPPKNEAWWPFDFEGQTLLFEPQQTSNSTYSWLDLYTPFVFRSGRLEFRKGGAETGIADADLEFFLDEMDCRSQALASLRRTPEAVAAGEGAERARLFRLLDDPADWPYFTLYRLELDGEPEQAAVWPGDHPPGAFQQLIVLAGEVEVDVVDPLYDRLGPATPAFVPATLEGGYVLRSSERSTVLLLSVPTPWDGGAGSPPIGAR